MIKTKNIRYCIATETRQIQPPRGASAWCMQMPSKEARLVTKEEYDRAVVDTSTQSERPDGSVFLTTIAGKWEG